MYINISRIPVMPIVFLSNHVIYLFSKAIFCVLNFSALLLVDLYIFCPNIFD